jgi:hypothetical protein
LHLQLLQHHLCKLLVLYNSHRCRLLVDPGLNVTLAMVPFSLAATMQRRYNLTRWQTAGFRRRLQQETSAPGVAAGTSVGGSPAPTPAGVGLNATTWQPWLLDDYDMDSSSSFPTPVFNSSAASQAAAALSSSSNMTGNVGLFQFDLLQAPAVQPLQDALLREAGVYGAQGE